MTISMSSTTDDPQRTWTLLTPYLQGRPPELPSGPVVRAGAFARLAIRACLLFLLLAIALAVFTRFKAWPWTGTVIHLLISVVYVIVGLSQVIIIAANGRAMLGTLGDPISTNSNAMSRQSPFELSTVRQLAGEPKIVLEHVHGQIKEACEGFRRRSAILVGALDRVGLIPGLVTLYIAHMAHEVGFATYIAIGAAFISAYAAHCHLLLSRWDRCLRLLDRAKEQCGNRPAGFE